MPFGKMQEMGPKYMLWNPVLGIRKKSPQHELAVAVVFHHGKVAVATHVSIT